MEAVAVTEGDIPAVAVQVDRLYLESRSRFQG